MSLNNRKPSFDTRNVKTECDAILFDLDGTLWDSVNEILLTWNQVITENGNFRRPITREEQEQLMGLQMDDIAKRLFPDVSDEQRIRYMKMCMEKENCYLSAHGGRLYERLEETLAKLKAAHTLCIVSNCQSGYIESFISAHRLEPYFSDFLCFGDTGCSKARNIQNIIRRNAFKKPVYVGDTQGDMLSAQIAGIPFIFAEYGFGCATEYVARVTCLSDLVTLLY